MKCGGIILCGGQSTRMGMAKAMLPFGEQTLLQRVVKTLSSVVEPIVIVAAEGQSLPKLPANITLARDLRPQRGPLEGLHAGLAALVDQAEAAYVTSCDVPLLTASFVRQMIDLLGDADIVVPIETDPQSGKPFYHPLAGVYRLSLLSTIDQLLSRDTLRLSALIDTVASRHVPVDELRSVDPDLLSLRNVNDQTAYQAALATAGLLRSAR